MERKIVSAVLLTPPECEGDESEQEETQAVVVLTFDDGSSGY